ncbi:hypothetical protein BH23ACT9_BH23ACT9_32130 [soil metagenome]
MGATTFTDDTITVSPPLNPREVSYLRRLNRSAEGRIARPGNHLPWWPSEDGTRLHLPPFGTREPIAEWASYLRTHLLGPSGPRLHGRWLSDFTYDHHLQGGLSVSGRAPTDRWTLECRPEGLVVRRQSMPCPACWAELLLWVRPTVAYRFLHPVRDANLVDGQMPAFDHDELGEACRTQSWAPAGTTTRPVVWPMPVTGHFHGWWIDLDATPDAVPYRFGDTDHDDEAPLGLAPVIPLPRRRADHAPRTA